MNGISLQESSGTFVVHEMDIAALRREWRCEEVPSGGGLNVTLSSRQCALAEQAGISVDEALIEKAVQLAVTEALSEPLAGAPGREVVVEAAHLRRAAR
jgi:hypothetical protein